MYIEELIKEFKKYKSVYCVEDTLKYYDICFERFIKAMDINIYDDIKVLDKELYMKYILYLRNEDIRSTSIKTYCRGIKVLYRYAYVEGYLDKDYTVAVKLPKNDCKLEMPLTDNEVSVIDSVVLKKGILGIRDYLIIHLMLDIGLRCKEVVQLKIEDIDYSNNYIALLDCKGSKNRIVPLPAKLKLYLHKYSNYRKMFDGDTLFMTNGFNKNITETTIKQMFTKLKKKCNINRLHAHLCRHTFATCFIMCTDNLEYLRVLMGHVDYNVTKNYIKLATQCKILNYDIYTIDIETYKKIGLLK